MSNKSDKIWVKFAKFRRVRLPRHIRQAKIVSRHPYTVPVVTLLLLIILTGGIYLLARHTNRLPMIENAKIVIISHDHVQQIVPSHEPTVGALLSKLHLHLNLGDVVEPALGTPIDQDEFRINIYRALPVEIVDNGMHNFTFSAATTPRSIAAQTGVTVYPEDYVTAKPTSNFLRQGAIGEQVVINRATPVNVNLYGTPVLMRTHASTVGQLINERHIKLASNDQILPAITTPITPNQLIFIARNGTKLESLTEIIPMPIQTLQDPTLAYGTSAVRQQGSNGSQVTTYQIDNQTGNRFIIQQVVIQPAVTEIVVVGTSLTGIKGDMSLAGIAASDYQYADYIISHESGWCPTKAQGEHYCPAVPDNQYTSYGYGLCQSTPGTKMSSAGSDWATNPVTQLRWCSGYAQNRYGGWYNAYAHWLNNHNW
ncbi:MAG TPA: ubiquitin-like domain-containing protein [Candidatus Dormibacteraeota bacterium]|nr:ubiquitin-like domain-containing protein [Candidatus Dormibacteraeota bacterium]